jgi:hypothetical protein
MVPLGGGSTKLQLRASCTRLPNVDVDNQSYERAAVWYVGAFGALGAILLGGASLAGVDWASAEHPVWALAVLCAAIAAAFVVVTLAALVIAPGFTPTALSEREDRLQGRIQRRNGGAPVTWEDIASEDRSLFRVLSRDEEAFDSSPNTLWARAKAGSAKDRDKLRSMVTSANVWRARRRFRILRMVTPIAAVVVLLGGLTWKPLTAPRQTDAVSSASPVPVQVTLAPSADPAKVIGPGCSLRQLNGVAIAGALGSDMLVAFGPQGDCNGALVVLSTGIAIISRR